MDENSNGNRGTREQSTAVVKMAQFPTSWIDRIFMRMQGRFGNQWQQKWAIGSLDKDGADVGIVNAKRTWTEELAGYSGSEIKSGIESSYAFPPSCDEFKLKCREPIKPETAFYEAVEQMQRRSTHTDKWSHPAIYWAAATIGTHDLHYGSWSSLGSRWTKIFSAQMQSGEWPAIPERLAALPPPPKGRSEQSEVKYKAEVGSVLGKKSDPKKWAKDHKRDYMAGKPVQSYQYNLATTALGETIEQWAAERNGSRAGVEN